MTYSQKYTLVYFISSVEDGTQFSMSDWPLHVTLADTFSVDRLHTSVDAKLSNLLSTIPFVNIEATKTSVLGATSVTLVQPTELLQKLHLETVALLEENNAVFNNPEFTKDGFLPHISSDAVSVGSKFTIDSVSLVDMFVGGDWQQRRVLGTFQLKAK